MKRFNKFFFAFLIIPCVLLFSGCGLATTYVSPLVTVDQILSSNIAEATNKAALSTVSIYGVGMADTGREVTIAGAGVIYQLDKTKGDAYIITNYHVTHYEGFLTSSKLPTLIYAYLYGYDPVDGAMACSYVGGSMTYDIAVLKITNNELLKNSSAKQVTISRTPAKLGSTTIVIGNPEGNGPSATTGIVSVESEYIQIRDYFDPTILFRSIRTDAPINGGNSGGGLFNELGELIGIVNAGADPAELDGVGLAIPLSIAQGVADNIIYGYETNTYKNACVLNTGIIVEAQNSKGIYDEETKLIYIRDDIIVTSVSGLFKAAGFEVGDKITGAKMGDVNIEFSRSFEFEDFLLTVRPGAKITFAVVRELGMHKINVETSMINFVNTD